MSEPSRRFQEAIKQGHSAAWDQQWGQAAVWYRQALEEAPDDPSTLANLGLALYQMGDLKEALKIYQRAAEVSPDNPLPLEKLAEICEQLKSLRSATDAFLRAAELYARSQDLNKAIEAWSRAIRITPEHLGVHSRLAMVYERLGRKQQAVTEYLAIASLLQHTGQVPKAIQAAQHALKIMPESKEAAQALQMLGTGTLLPKLTRHTGTTGQILSAKTKKYDLPKESEDVKSSLDPLAETRQRATSDLAAMLFEQEEQSGPADAAGVRRGMQAIVQGIGLGGKNADQTRIFLHVSQAIDLGAQNRDQEAAVDLERAIEAGLDHPAASYLLGAFAFQGGKYEDAQRYLLRSVNHASYAIGSRLLLGKTYHKMGRLQQSAVEHLEALRLADSQLVPTAQADALSRVYEPIIEDQAEKDEKAHLNVIKNVSEMLIKPGWRESLLRARQQLPPPGASGAPPPALAEILTETMGGKMVENISRIHILARSGYYRAAMEEAHYALQHAPTYLPLHIYLGDLLAQQKRNTAAIDKYAVVARSYSSRGEARRAVDMYRRILEISPMDMTVRARLIEQLVSHGNIETAIAEYLSLAELYHNLADLISARKTYADALRLAHSTNIDKAVKLKILHHMADLDMQSLDWRSAIRMYEQMRNLSPADQEARAQIINLNFRLAQVSPALTELDDYLNFLAANKKMSQAESFLEQLVEENPRQPGLRRYLAEIYRQKGRIPDAIAQLDEAGDMLIQTGDLNAAIEVVNAILGLEPPNANEYQRVLAHLKSKV